MQGIYSFFIGKRDPMKMGNYGFLSWYVQYI